LQFAEAGSAAALSQQEENNTEDVQLGRFYVGSGKLILPAKYLWRIRVAGRSFAAATMHDATYTCGTKHSRDLFRISVLSCFLQKFKKRN
jgi:hypothetical protein